MKILSELDITRRVMIEYADEVCDKHHKEIRKIFNDGQAVCPLCFTKKMTEGLRVETLKKIEKRKLSEDYNVLKKHSLVSDKGLEDAKISNFQSYCNETDANKKRVIELLRRIMDGENMSVWFSGNTGVGKSHLAMAMLDALNEASIKQIKESKHLPFEDRLKLTKSCLFVNVNFLMDSIRESFSNEQIRTTPKYMVDLLTSVDYLVLDDIGSEVGGIDTNKKASDFVTKTLYAIVTGRQDKTTIYTTNLSGVALKKLYDDKAFSRMTKNSESVVFRYSRDQRGGGLDF